MASLYLSAAHKSSGKTTLSVGICAALVERGVDLQPFKKGPDYIDPGWLGMAAGKPCYNLDFYIAGRQETLDDYRRRGAGAGLCLVEGNKGLYDGVSLDGGNSNADLAKAIESPVVLVIDVRGFTRGIAPLLIGYRVFDPEVDIAGVIVNMAAGARHEARVRAAIEEYTDVPFLGSLPRNAEFELDERHLGLVPGYEDVEARRKIDTIARAVGYGVDLDALLEISKRAGSIESAAATPAPIPDFDGIRIGIARDRAFGFYYPGDLEAFERAGARLVPVDLINDRELPEIDGLFIGGGFPERHAEALAANREMRGAVRRAIEAGLPAYAECGGLMYLSRELCWNGERYDMAGVLPASTRVYDKPQGRGYVELEEAAGSHPWSNSGEGSAALRAHEFHYSALDGLDDASRFAYRMRRGTGIDDGRDGLVYRNLLATYSHLRNTEANPWVSRFLRFVDNHRAETARAGAAALRG